MVPDGFVGWDVGGVSVTMILTRDGVWYGLVMEISLLVSNSAMGMDKKSLGEAGADQILGKVRV